MEQWINFDVKVLLINKFIQVKQIRGSGRLMSHGDRWDIAISFSCSLVQAFMLYQKKAFTIDFYPHYFSNFFKRIYGLLGRMYVFFGVWSRFWALCFVCCTESTPWNSELYWQVVNFFICICMLQVTFLPAAPESGLQNGGCYRYISSKKD